MSDTPPPALPHRRILLPIALAMLVLAIFIVVITLNLTSSTDQIWTDDAYVTAHVATIAPRISGQVAAVAVEDNRLVRAGALLLTLDDHDQRTALAAAEGAIARDRAELADAVAALARQPAVITQSSTASPSASARLTFAVAEQERYRALARVGAGSVQEREHADEEVQEAHAALAGTLAATEAARLQSAVLRARVDAEQGVIVADQARLDQARLDLGYTRIAAPIAGMIGQRSVQVGNHVGPGTPLMAVIPLDDVFIVANYREEALRHVLPGQHVRIHVDSYDVVLNGVVDSVPAGSGAAFSALPPNNATGNFTKIVQRLPVKILVAPNQPASRLLRIGMSVETTVNTAHADVVGRQNRSAETITATEP